MKPLNAFQSTIVIGFIIAAVVSGFLAASLSWRHMRHTSFQTCQSITVAKHYHEKLAEAQTSNGCSEFNTWGIKKIFGPDKICSQTLDDYKYDWTNWHCGENK